MTWPLVLAGQRPSGADGPGGASRPPQRQLDEGLGGKLEVPAAGHDSSGDAGLVLQQACADLAVSVSPENCSLEPDPNHNENVTYKK